MIYGQSHKQNNARIKLSEADNKLLNTWGDHPFQHHTHNHNYLWEADWGIALGNKWNDGDARVSSDNVAVEVGNIQSLVIIHASLINGWIN